MKVVDKSFLTWRLKIVRLVFFIMLILVISFLFRWQILDYDKYRILANQRVKDSQLASLRGTIYSRDGSTLAYSEPVYDIYMYTPEIKIAEETKTQTREEFVEKVSNALEIEKDKIYSMFNSKSVYIPLKKEVSYETKKKVENLTADRSGGRKFAGIHFEPKEKRIYPDGTLASHLLGFVGKNTLGDDIGRNGIEGYWNGDLAWKKGFIIEETDSFGNQILTGKYEPIYPKVGRSIKLTIDRALQEVIERKIKEGVERYKSLSGTAIVLDPKTGFILAMANYPNYDPNNYKAVNDLSIFRNKAVSDPYEFGSVGKCFTAAAAIDLGKASPDTQIVSSHEGCVNVLDDKSICTASKKPSGKLTLTDVLAYSDNIGAFYTAELVGAKNFYNYLLKFGIGTKTNAGFEDESTSLLKNGDNWNRADIAVYSYGQGYSATPLQIISAISAIPNHGIRMQPQIVLEIIDEEKTIKVEPKVASVVLSNEGANITNKMLEAVFNRNGSKFKFKELTNYRLAGKSGTASVLDDNGLGYAQDKVNVTFVGWDSSENSKFVMLMKLQEPAGALFSVDSVQPLWMETFLEIKDLLGVIPVVKEK